MFSGKDSYVAVGMALELELPSVQPLTIFQSELQLV